MENAEARAQGVARGRLADSVHVREHPPELDRLGREFPRRSLSMNVRDGSPNRIVSRTFWGRSRHGAFMSKGICSESWRSMDLRFIIMLFAPYLHALTAPARTLLESSGTASSAEARITLPIPPQWRHAPSGWLKEKLRTVRSLKVSPQISQASAQLSRSGFHSPAVCDCDE